jgi:type IV fimbrial biogenesis protein FimT
MDGKRNGFTLIEALVAMAGLAATCCIALPALGAANAKARDMTIRSAMVETLQRATTHAIATRTHVVLCPSHDGQTCTRGTDWTPGWIAFADLGANRERDGGFDTLLHAQPRLQGRSRLRGSAGRTRIVVQPRGDTAGSNATFTICREGSTAHATALILANSGRWRFAHPAANAASACAYGG